MTPPLIHKIALSLFPRVGAVNARRLVAYLGSVSAIFEVSNKDLNGIPGIGKTQIKNIINNREQVLEKATSELVFIEKYKIQTFFYLDTDYPQRLAQCEDAPVILFLKGNVNLNSNKIISIVGTRNASDYGRELTYELISGLKKNGIEALVVSGLAYGIDITAHKAALKEDLPTLGVVGHGLDKLYPASHASIAKDMIAKNGGLLSDFPSGAGIDPGNFIRRNRIIAGLADCTIVVESAEKGGSLITADIANSYNREVFAFPGRITDQYSLGCNKLIKKNLAALIEQPTDLIEYMGWETKQNVTQQSLFIELDENEKQIVKLLQVNEVANTDFISRSINLPVQKINSILLNLEFKSVIKSLPGNRFRLIMKVHV